jgi:hypothetical protein
MIKVLGFLFATALLSASLPARAQDSVESDEGIAKSGPLRGTSVEKRIVVLSLIGAAAISYGAAGYFWFEAMDRDKDREAVWGDRPEKFCRPGETLDQCAAAQKRYDAAVDSQDDSLTKLSVAGIAGSGLMFGAVLTMLLWPDDGNALVRRTKVQAAPTETGFVIGVSHAY